MPIYLHGLGLQFFRGIGGDKQRLYPFKEFNFFIGANNSGKSTVLDFLYKYLPTGRKEKNIPGGLDVYTGPEGGKTPIGLIGIPLELFQRSIALPVQPHHKNLLNRICTALADDDVVWLQIPLGRSGEITFDVLPSLDHLQAAKISRDDIYGLWATTYRSSGGDFNHWITQISTDLLRGQKPSFPTVQIIPAIRQIGPTSQAFEDLSGRGLIDKLAAIQSPDHDKRKDYETFEAINDFLQVVTGRTHARIEIPHNRAHVLVHMDNKVLPLSSLGTGVHEVIMIASFCTLNQDQIICIEEPEIHLHPLLQRKLISYLQQNTRNQYFIATHSANFIDTQGAAIFHVTNDGAHTRIKESILRSERFSICADLGAKASDILQSNAIIWVEGPSDRIYLNHWLKNSAPSLVEGIHYSIMFYGGRLLSHLSADDEAVSEFIALRNLNRHLAIVIDSDKDSAHARINPTKARLRDELSKGLGVAWVTKGREIENYIEHSVLQEAVKAAHPQTYHSASKGGPYDNALSYRRQTSSFKAGRLETKINKVKVANIVTHTPLSLDVMDLRKNIRLLIKMIESANT